MIRHTVAKLGVSTALLAVALVASAFRHPEHEELPNLDKRRPGETASPATVAKRELARELGGRVKGLQVQVDPVLGVPRWVGSTESYLTGPRGVGRGVTAANAARFPANDPHRAVKAFVHEHAALFGHGVEALDRARVDRDSVAAHSGLRTVVWQQELDGIPVFNARLTGHLTAKGELVSVASQFVPDLDGAAARSLPNRAALRAASPVSAAQAIQLAGRHVGENAEAATLVSFSAPEGAARRQKFSGGNLIGESETRLAYFPMTAGELRLAWDVLVTRRRGGEMFRVLIDVQTGEVLLRHCLTAYLTNATYNVFTGDSPSPFSPGHATPMTGQPPLVSRTLVTLPALNTNASPNGWIDDAINETRGNNVDAHLDRNADNKVDLPRPQGSPFRVFDFPMDLAQSPTETNNQKAAVVQLFYLCNWIHDKLYELGFTEAAGNFQGTNFGRGGLGNDPVVADAQDGAGFNNANFGTPYDGSPPRMQMYLFDGPNPDRDGDLDAEIVIHEYVHGLSNRRVGNGTLISALQTSGMGEGWSDFYALALLAEPGDALDGEFAVGAYATLQFFGLNENYYYGIRRYPYSTNLSKNPLTFKDIDGTQASSHAGIPRSPVIGNTAGEVHNQGEVWCVALWEVRANLVAKFGFATGNQLALQLVTDGMGLTPANPNFLEARDGILQADLVLNGGANRDEIWAGFAKRGMGFSATSPASSTTTGVVEAFDLPDDLRVTPGAGLIASGPVGGSFTPAGQTYTLTNVGSSNLTWAAGTSSNWLTLSTNGGTLPAGGPAGSLTLSFSAAAAALPMGQYTNLVRITNLTSGRVQTRVFVVAIGQPDSYTEIFESLDNDLSFGSLRFTPDGSSSFYGVCRNVATNFPTDPTGGTVVALSDDSFIQVTLANGAQVSLYGTNHGSFFIGSNGYLTFGQGDISYAESIAAHFDRRRISGLFVDLDPSKGGTISWKQLPDRVVVTWQAVREYATTRENNFQIELFFTGQVTITHLALASQHGLAGLSRGVAPALFVESDLSAYPFCVPTLTLSLPAVTQEGAGVLVNQGILRLDAPVGTNVVASLQSTDTNEIIVPSSVTILAGQTSNFFSLTVVDDTVADGSKMAQITAMAPGFVGAMAIITNLDNDPVTPQASNLVFTIRGDAFTNLPLRGFAPNGGSLAYFVTTLPTNGVLSTPVLPTKLVGYTPAHGFVGADEFRYQVSEGSQISTPALVSITVIAPLDSDGDGLPDGWENAHGLNPTVNDAAEDPDGDGLTNLQEYVADSDPQNNASGSLAPQVLPLPGGRYLLTWRSVGGVRYRVQYSDGDVDGNFNGTFTDIVRPASSEIDPASVGVSSANFFTDDFTHPGGTPAHGNRYYRVKIVR